MTGARGLSSSLQPVTETRSALFLYRTGRDPDGVASERDQLRTVRNMLSFPTKDGDATLD